MEWQQQDAAVEQPPAMSAGARQFVVGTQRAAAGVARHWLFFINGFFGLLVLGAIVTPVLMHLGLEGPGNLLYKVYSFTCHQLPERSYFFFTPQAPVTTYGLPEIVAAGADDTSLLTLREFVGNPSFGWKAGFSDRMFSMYGGAFLGGVLYSLLSRRGRVKPLPIWLMILMVLPMALDGGSHFLSEITGWGFRESNDWARPLFGAQPELFFTGTTVGSLNAILRLVTGLLFGVGIMLFAYPLIGYGFDDLADEAQTTLARNEARLRSSEG